MVRLFLEDFEMKDFVLFEVRYLQAVKWFWYIRGLILLFGITVIFTVLSFMVLFYVLQTINE